MITTIQTDKQTVDTYVNERDLTLYPEVQWDRFGLDYAFGWIARDDDKFDFAILTYVPNDDSTVDVSIISSSAKYNREFGSRLGATKHQNCKRIEDFFSITNMIKLK